MPRKKRTTTTAPTNGDTVGDELTDLWRIAADMDRDQPVEGGRGRWIPWRVVQVRPELLPRPEPDQAVVDRYAGIFDLLPPIRVQQDTYVLIGGLHRLHATPASGRAHVRAYLEDVPDTALADEAAHDNSGHGLPLTAEQRMRAAQGVYQRHHPDTPLDGYEAWTPERIGSWSGISYRTIAGWLAKDRERSERREAAAKVTAGVCTETGEILEGVVSVGTDQFVQFARTDFRVGVDGRQYPTGKVTGGSAARTGKGKAATRTYQNAAALERPVANDYQPSGSAQSLALAERIVAALDRLVEASGEWPEGLAPRELAMVVPDEQVEVQLGVAERNLERWQAYAAELVRRMPVASV